MINWWPRTINSTSLTFFRWVQCALAALPHPGSFTHQAPAQNFAINLVYCPPLVPMSLLFQAAAAAAAKLLQSFPTLCDPIDGSPPGSPVPGILQARTLEWVAISFSSAWKWKVKVKLLSPVRLLATPWTAAYQVPPFMGFSCFRVACSKNTTMNMFFYSLTLLN